MRVGAGRFQIRIPKQNLDGRQVGTIFQQVSRETMPQHVKRKKGWPDLPALARFAHCLRGQLEESLEIVFRATPIRIVEKFGGVSDGFKN